MLTKDGIFPAPNKQNIVPLSCLNQKSLHYPGGKGCGLSHVVVRVLWST